MTLAAFLKTGQEAGFRPKVLGPVAWLVEPSFLPTSCLLHIFYTSV